MTANHPTLDQQADVLAEIVRRTVLDLKGTSRYPWHPEDVVAHVTVALDGAVVTYKVLHDKGVL